MEQVLVLFIKNASAYTYGNVVIGSDGWNPRTHYQPAETPINLLIDKNGKLTWDAAKYAIYYIVYKDGNVIDFTTSTSYTDASVTQDNVYTVKSVNEYGSLGEMSKAVTPTPNTSIEKEKVSDKLPLIDANEDNIIIKNINPGTLVSIFTIDGKLLTQKKSNTDLISIKTTFNKGMYLIKVNNITFKIIQ